MWTLFFAGTALLTLFVYSTFFLLRGLGLERLESFAFAPIAFILLSNLLAIAYQKSGLFCNWILIVIPIALTSCLVCLLKRCWSKKVNHKKARKIKSELGYVALYASVGLAIGLFVFVKPLDGPACFTQTYDDITNLALIRSFTESGNYSSLATTTSPEFSDYAVGSYYPSAWHLLAALLVSSMGMEIPMAANATCYVIACVVYPISCLTLLKSLFGDKKTILIAGSVICLCSVAFPWYFLVYGKLCSNLLGFALFPLIASSFISAFSANDRKMKIQFGCLFISGIATCVFTQPNVVFSLVIFLGAFCFSRIAHSDSHIKGRLLIGFSALFVLFWLVSCNLPFLYGVVTFFWPAKSNLIQAMADVLLSSTSYTPAQIVLSAVTLVGFVSICKNRDNLWLALPCLLCSVIYIICAASDSHIKCLFGGFWYTDQYRISAMLSMFEMPILCLGYSFLWNSMATLLDKKQDQTFSVIIKICAALTSLALVFCSSFNLRGIGSIETPFGFFKHKVESVYSASNNKILFSPEEREFVEKAQKITGDSKVINSPYDGSLFAYQIYGMHTYYRSAQPPQEETRKIIRESLSEYGSNKSVKDAVAEIDAQYVLLLEPEEKTGVASWPAFNEGDWAGIDRISDNTPGFTAVLSEGNMRLYQINR